MKLEIGNNQGHVIVDEATGKIMFIMVQNVVEGKFDFQTFASMKNNHDGTHNAVRWIKTSPCSNHSLQQDGEEEAEKRMLIIMQNGNTGEHYDLGDE